MKIKYYGNSCFLFKSKDSKLITNPKDEGAKINLKRCLPDIIVLTNKGKVAQNKHYVISTPGEYEVKDIFIYGYMSDLNRKNSIADIYMIDVEGVHLGLIDRGVKVVKGRILNEMGIVNVLFVSLAKDAGMSLSKLTDLVNKIEPQIVIPMDYTDENLSNFMKVLGVKELEKESTLYVRNSDFAAEEIPMRVVVLEN